MKLKVNKHNSHEMLLFLISYRKKEIKKKMEIMFPVLARKLAPANLQWVHRVLIIHIRQ